MARGDELVQLSEADHHAAMAEEVRRLAASVEGPARYGKHGRGARIRAVDEAARRKAARKNAKAARRRNRR
ncbi:MAG TPA: hypothetical protein VF024_11200 [Solirubrobacteraceae bacterium]